MFQNKVLRIFGLRRVEVMGDWRRLHNEELKLFVFLTQYRAGDTIGKNEMGWACDTHGCGGVYSLGGETGGKETTGET